MRHRENFDELVGHLDRDAVHLTLPNRMALLALNNKVFANGMEAHLEAAQAQGVHQQAYIPPPPMAPPMPAGQAAAPADGPPSWMTAGLNAAKTGAATGFGAWGSASGIASGVLGSMASGGVAAAKTVYNQIQSQNAAATAIDNDDWFSVTGASDMTEIEDAHELQMRHHEQNLADLEAHRQHAAIEMMQNAHQRNPFHGGADTHELMGQDTSGAQAIMQMAMESQRPTLPHDGSDLVETPGSSSQAWLTQSLTDQPTADMPTAIVPQLTGTAAPVDRSRSTRTQRAVGPGGKAKRTRPSNWGMARGGDPARDTHDYHPQDINPTGGGEGQMDYLLRQQRANQGQERRYTTGTPAEQVAARNRRIGRSASPAPPPLGMRQAGMFTGVFGRRG